MEKLPTVEKVDCITVSTLPVKNAIDGQLQQLFDMLLDSLRHRVTSDVVQLNEFVTAATNMLQVLPQTIGELGEANAK